MSHLGCHNNRQQQLKKLAKSTAARLVQHYAQEQLVTQNANANTANAGQTAVGATAGNQGAAATTGAQTTNNANIQKENTITGVKQPPMKA